MCTACQWWGCPPNGFLLLESCFYLEKVRRYGRTSSHGAVTLCGSVGRPHCGNQPYCRPFKHKSCTKGQKLYQGFPNLVFPCAMSCPTLQPLDLLGRRRRAPPFQRKSAEIGTECTPMRPEWQAPNQAQDPAAPARHTPSSHAHATIAPRTTGAPSGPRQNRLAPPCPRATHVPLGCCR